MDENFESTCMCLGYYKDLGIQMLREASSYRWEFWSNKKHNSQKDKQQLEWMNTCFFALSLSRYKT